MGPCSTATTTPRGLLAYVVIRNHFPTVRPDRDANEYHDATTVRHLTNPESLVGWFVGCLVAVEGGTEVEVNHFHLLDNELLPPVMKRGEEAWTAILVQQHTTTTTPTTAATTTDVVSSRSTRSDPCCAF